MAKKSKPATKPAKEFKPRFERIAAVPPRLPKKATLSRVVETKSTLYRCLAENTVQIRAFEYSRRFGPGQIVDLDEDIGKGSKLRDHVRNNCFEPMRTGGE